MVALPSSARRSSKRMRKLPWLPISCVVGLAGAVQPPAMAQSEEFTLAARGDLRWVSNAELRPSSDTETSEAQWRGSLLANGGLSGSWARFSTDYQLLDRRFSELDYNNEQLLLGQSELNFGPASQDYYLSLTHASAEIALDPLAGDLPENRDRRTVVGAKAYSSGDVGQANRMALWLEAADISFDVSATNDATRVGAGWDYIRLVSPIAEAGISLSGYQLTYQESDQEMRYQRAAVWWASQLRSWSYAAHVGYNEAEFEGDTFGEPYLQLLATYERGVQAWEFSARQWVSDTSQGSQNDNSFESVVGQDGRPGVIDQYRRRDVEVAWRHNDVCGSCQLELAVGGEEEDYRSETALNSTEWFTRAGLSYKASALINLAFLGAYTSVKTGDGDTVGEYDNIEARITLSLLNVIRDGTLEAFVGGITRDYDFADGYSSGYVGIAFTYQLYSHSR